MAPPLGHVCWPPACGPTSRRSLSARCRGSRKHARSSCAPPRPPGRGGRLRRLCDEAPGAVCGAAGSAARDGEAPGGGGSRASCLESAGRAWPGARARTTRPLHPRSHRRAVHTTQRSGSHAGTTSTLRPDESDDPVGRHLRILVLPDPDRVPSCGDEPLVGVAIPVFVSCDLVPPVPAVGAVLAPAVLGAAVPKAPVHEDSDLGTKKNDVGLPGEAWQWTPVDAVAPAASVEDAAERQLGPVSRRARALIFRWTASLEANGVRQRSGMSAATGWLGRRSRRPGGRAKGERRCRLGPGPMPDGRRR